MGDNQTTDPTVVPGAMPTSTPAPTTGDVNPMPAAPAGEAPTPAVDEHPVTPPVTPVPPTEAPAQ